VRSITLGHLPQVVVLVIHRARRAVWRLHGVLSIRERRQRSELTRSLDETAYEDSPPAVTSDGQVAKKGQILSIGQGRHSLSSLVVQLQHRGTLYLVDVRSTPYSRHVPEFAREYLESNLKDGPVKYMFMGDLLGGRPSDADCYTDGRVDYGKVRSRPFFVRGINRLQTAYEKGLRICLLCSEGQPTQCHRSKLIGEELAARDISIVHILPDGSEMTQREVMTELAEGQTELFPTGLMSRKQYRPARTS